MTLEQLKMLKSVAEFGSLKAASEKMYKTQPAISQGIKQLERSLNVQLFNREGYRLKLTSQGQQIYQHSLKLLNEVTHIQQLSEYFSEGNEASICLAFEASFDLNKMLPVLEKTQNEFPNTQIIIKQEYITGAFEALQQETADIAISPIEPFLRDNDYEFLPLYQGFLVNVASPRLLKRHQHLQHSSELLGEYQIIVQDSGQGTQGKDFWVQAGQRRWYVNEFETKKTLIQSGMGWGHLPKSLILKELNAGLLVELALQDMENEIELSYCAIKQKSKYLGPVASKLWINLQCHARH
jgi:DNA-binding transcriptional LysR family regulator